MITIFNGGCDSRHPIPLDCIYTGSDYLLLFVKTDAFFEVERRIVSTPPNTVILYRKGARIHYGRSLPHYNDNWVHFDLSPDEEDLPHALQIPFDTPVPLKQTGQINELMRLVAIASLSNDAYREKILDSYMHALLYHVASLLREKPDPASSHKYYQDFNRLRLEILNSPQKEWSVESMADSIHLSPSYFQHLYKEFFGQSCMQEVIQARLRLAKFYLSTTNQSIQSLAPMCGYESELHFMKQFKKNMNMTPSQYRLNCQAKN